MKMSDARAEVRLIRHAQSHANAGLATEFPKTIGLSELGLEQAQALASRLDLVPDRIVVSPFDRTLATAQPLIAKLADAGQHTPVVEWPIQEFTYLSPLRCRGTTAADRQVWAREYWQRADPDWEDGDGAESFRQMMLRVVDFSQRLNSVDGVTVVFGHGMFFKAFLLALEYGTEVSSDAMTRYRRLESERPIHNGQIVRLTPTPSGSWRVWAGDAGHV